MSLPDFTGEWLLSLFSPFSFQSHPFPGGRNKTEGILEWFSDHQSHSMFHYIKASDYAVRLQYNNPTLVKRQGSIVSRRQNKESLGLEFA